VKGGSGGSGGSGGPGLQVHASGSRYELQVPRELELQARLNRSRARPRIEARWGARLPTALLLGGRTTAAPLTSCLAGHGGREGEGEGQEEPVPGGAAVQQCSTAALQQEDQEESGRRRGRWAEGVPTA
jgi:hypothetical protein